MGDSLRLAKNFPSAHKISEQSHSELSSAWEEDPTLYFETTTVLLLKKACLHITAALRANQTSNMHSLAAQMRPALECAGQVVSTMKDLFDQSSKGKSAVLRRANADYYHTMTRLARGQIDPRELLADIARIQAANDDTDRTKGRFDVRETVKDLEFGGEWYDHLSRCFYHSDLAALKTYSYYGGVRSNNSVNDQIAFATLLDYLTNQVLVMILNAAMCPPETAAKKQCYERAVALIEEKRKTLDSCRDALVMRVQQTDATPRAS
ncbi:MAG: hypothetical protein F4Y72_10285 [Gammaproteobacteria bacterium]|nr:hypothetical protein [Gammaproteobacteria bacterium]